jgi:hypothetical protein
VRLLTLQREVAYQLDELVHVLPDPRAAVMHRGGHRQTRTGSHPLDEALLAVPAAFMSYP